MSAYLHGPSFRSRRRPQPPTTLDLDPTADVYEENTADLESETVDIAPSAVPAIEPARAAPVARRSESEPIVAPDVQTLDAAAPTAVPKLADVVDRAPMPSRRREPSVSPPTIPISAAQPVTADVPQATAASTTQRPSQPATADINDSHSHVVMEAPASPASAATRPRKPDASKAGDSRRPALAPGTVLCDRYLLEQVIGCGGTAIVFRARDMLSARGTEPNRQVAIKTPRPELGNPQRAAQRLKHEFEHAKLLSHPSIVRVLELHEDEGRCFMTMELVQGRLLSELLRDWTMMPQPLAHKILRKCAEALQYAHSQNVVHGDFKPGNVFITPDEDIRIVDFGTATGQAFSDSRIPAGTPTYASPEVLSGATPDVRDDVFSFACVAYEVLTGQHPFGRQSSLQARDELKIPPRAWNLSTSQWLSLLSALSWKREQRPASVEELLTRLAPEPPATAAPIQIAPEEVVPAELPADLMPKQRSWGFFAFIACALLVAYYAFQRRNAQEDGAAPAIVPAAVSAPSAPAHEPVARPAIDSVPPAAEQAEAAAESSTTPASVAPVARARPAPPAVSEISFESSTIVTSESSVAAVFLIKRSQPLSGRVSVSWKAVSGTADAGIDFASDASGTVTFADGQAQRAIYVPLRNDLLAEGDETFYVELSSPKSARLGKIVRAEAIIRDDD
jgi:tRNA A-37 threonylcarbamoyl transferase component Bud32